MHHQPSHNNVTVRTVHLPVASPGKGQPIGGFSPTNIIVIRSRKETECGDGILGI
jgi:hypothetical protein